MNNKVVESQLDDCVGNLPLARVLGVDNQRPQHEEKGLQHYPDQLAEGAVEQRGFDQRWDVCVQDFIALAAVVLHVVSLEGHGEWDADGKVGKDPQDLVGQRVVDAEAMAVPDLMYSQHQGVVDDATKAISGQNDHRP